MFTASNSLSFIRAPLAFLFLQDNAFIRVLAIFLAMLTDIIDGYLARRNKSVSKLGAVLDPVTDKFFVSFAIAALFLENKLSPFELMAMLSRDCSLCLYGLTMFITNQWRSIILFKAIRWGKVTTSLQFIALVAATLGIALPWYFFTLFIVLGLLAFFELFQESTAPAN